jgi:uncharacterized protein with GYD domain
MPMYVSLMKLTEQGIKNIKDAPQRVEDAAKGLEALGGCLHAFYLVMGEYDYVAISEGPSDEVAMTFLLALGAGGNTRTTTMKAFPREAFKELVGRLP